MVGEFRLPSPRVTVRRFDACLTLVLTSRHCRSDRSRTSAGRPTLCRRGCGCVCRQKWLSGRAGRASQRQRRTRRSARRVSGGRGGQGTRRGQQVLRVPCVKRYTERKPTAYEHAWEIRDAHAYHEYEDAEWSRRFRTFLHGRAWTHAEGPVTLFDQSVGWLRRHRVLLPGVSVLARRCRRRGRLRRSGCMPRSRGRAAGGPGVARRLGGDAEDAGGLAVLGAGAVAPAADADNGHRVRPRAGARG